MRNKYSAILIYLVLSFSVFLFCCFISQIKNAYPNQNKSILNIIISFENQQSRMSSGFLINKESRFFVVMTTHAFHLTENWIPQNISITINNLKKPIEINYEDLENYYVKHGEETNEYIDTSIIEITNIPYFKESKQDIEKSFLDYDNLAKINEIERGSKLYINSIYGEKEAVLEEIEPVVSSQNLRGFKIGNCNPKLNINGGDSGGLIQFKKGNRELILGMILKKEGDGSSGYAVNSIKIKETIDMAINKK